MKNSDTVLTVFIHDDHNAKTWIKGTERLKEVQPNELLNNV